MEEETPLARPVALTKLVKNAGCAPGSSPATPGDAEEAFSQFMSKAFAPGALDIVQKELMTIALSQPSSSGASGGEECCGLVNAPHVGWLLSSGTRSRRVFGGLTPCRDQRTDVSRAL